MTIRGQLTKDDFLEFQRLNLRQSKFVDCGNTLIYFFFLSLLAVLGFLEKDLVGKWMYYLPLFAILLIIPFLHLVYLPLKWRQFYKQDRELSLPVDIELGEKEIVTGNSVGKAARAWKDFRKWKENDRLLLLYLAENKAVPLPKRFFSQQELAFVYERLRSHNVPKAKPFSAFTCVTFAVVGLAALAAGIAAAMHILLQIIQ
ncbi:MAG: YcxB family protein [Anaerolineales bacterium]|nr:YcxB family protein [Anaerolineales bacterium]